MSLKRHILSGHEDAWDILVKGTPQSEIGS